MTYLGNEHPRSLIRKALYDSLYDKISGIGESVYIGHSHGFDEENAPLIYIDLGDSTSDLNTNCLGLRQYKESVNANIVIGVIENNELEAIDLCENYARQVEKLIASPKALIDDESFIISVRKSSLVKEQEIAGRALVVITLGFIIEYNDQYLPL